MSTTSQWPKDPLLDTIASCNSCSRLHSLGAARRAALEVTDAALLGLGSPPISYEVLPRTRRTGGCEATSAFTMAFIGLVGMVARTGVRANPDQRSRRTRAVLAACRWHSRTHSLPYMQDRSPTGTRGFRPQCLRPTAFATLVGSRPGHTDFRFCSGRNAQQRYTSGRFKPSDRETQLMNLCGYPRGPGNIECGTPRGSECVGGGHTSSDSVLPTTTLS